MDPANKTATTKRVLIPVAMATGILLSANHVSRAGSNDATMNNTQNPNSTLDSRGLPLVLFNNDAFDLAAHAYQEHFKDVWGGTGHPLPLSKINSLDDYLAFRIGPLAKTKTQGLAYCGNYGGPGVPTWELKRDHIAALGDDPLRPILQFWKRDGRTFFFSLRMNDPQDLAHTVGWSDFRRAHPNLLLQPPTDKEWKTEFVPWLEGKAGRPAGGQKPYGAYHVWGNDWVFCPFAYDYSQAEVRRYFLGILSEACRRYELDGVELDWLRDPFCFREGEVNVATMTAFVHDARAIVDAAAKRRGHPIRLVTRVPVTPEKTLYCGLDVEAWLKAGWLDAVIAGPGTSFSSCPLELWVALAHRYGVPVYGAIEPRNLQSIPRFGNAETLRAGAATLWEKGADGLYFFNFFNRADMPLIDELADRARLARLPKEFFLEGPTRKWDLGNEGGPLPLEITPATAAKVSLFIAEDPAQAREVCLEMQFSGAFEPPEITLNSHPLKGLTTKRGAGLTLTLASAELKNALKRGLNEFSFTPAAGDNCGGLVLAPEWTVFGPCDKTDPAPATAGLAVCPATLRLGVRELVARQVKATDRGINLGELFGGHRERQGAWVYITVTAPRAGRYVIGLGADWWLEAFLDGKPLLSTLDTGNKRNNHPFIKPNRNDQIAKAELMAGVHTLAVRVLSGSTGWMLDAGPVGTTLTALSVRVAP